MTHADFFAQAVALTATQLPDGATAHSAEYPMRVAELIRHNYQAVVLAWNDIQPAEQDKPR